MTKTPLDIPVVDLFAGPGGLSEGFSRFRASSGDGFSISLSVEKDPIAYQTLLLRSFFRQFSTPPNEYYARLRRELSDLQLFEEFKHEYTRATKEAINIELGPKTHGKVDRLVSSMLQGKRKRWALIGGPPCQAYSVVGRARMSRMDRNAFERDGRHYLYREYLRILRKFQPPVFVMENVKGILSSTIKDRLIFSEIIRDFRTAGYTLHSFFRLHDGNEPDPTDFVIQAEHYGIPQTRHRVIILGIRKDLDRGRKVIKPELCLVSISEAIRDLPRIRSQISGPGGRPTGSFAEWREIVERTSLRPVDFLVREKMKRGRRNRKPARIGGEFLPAEFSIDKCSCWLRKNASWFLDRRIGGVIQHTSRAHMESDLQRYFFAACFALAHGRSPKLVEFPEDLWPAHENAKAAADEILFGDRFRVQVRNGPSSTIVSHISKDGHYYIHHDPTQCRSLTVREAARLQTFSDNYFFAGNRTAQYQQVGNAVPPLLARKLAEVVYDVLSQLKR